MAKKYNFNIINANREIHEQQIDLRNEVEKRVNLTSFKEWQKVLALVTLFTIGHTLSLIVSSFGIFTVDSSIIEFLIPVTIILAAVYNLKIADKNTTARKHYGQYIATLFFGLIHGFGFSTYFKMFNQPLLWK